MEIIKKHKNLKSFTLIELTVSMGVLALIVGLTAGVLISVVKSYQKQRIIAEIERNGDFVVRTLEENLRGATSISCLGFDGSVVAADVSGVTACNLGTNSSPGRLLVINSSKGTKYIGRGSGTSASCPVQTDPPTIPNCYAYMLTSINSADNQIVSGALPKTNVNLTNNAVANGVDITKFDVRLSGGGTSGAPYNITVTIDIKGSIGSLGENETRTFQSFLTLRGSYQ